MSRAASHRPSPVMEEVMVVNLVRKSIIAATQSSATANTQRQMISGRLPLLCRGSRRLWETDRM